MISKSLKKKYFMVVGVLLMIAGISIGFAAYQRTLTIQSSATVTPIITDDMSIKISSSSDRIDTSDIVPELVDIAWAGNVTDFTASNAIINNTSNPTISGIQVDFVEQDRVALYPFFIWNDGNTDVRLTEIVFNNVIGSDAYKVCKAVETTNGNKATDSVVESVCGDISIRVYVNGIPFNTTTTLNPDDTGADEFIIERGSFISANVYIEYASDGEVADGPIAVEFGDIEFIYSTIDS